MFKRLAALLLALALVTGLFSGCGKDPEDQILRCDLSANPASLDPQLASSPEALLVIENSFEGLLRQDGSGALGPGTALNYSVSEDGLTYLFELRDDALWSDGETPVTAGDFVFAFQRLLDPSTGSPYAGNYTCIRNGALVLAGEADPSALGVHADDDLTLRVELDTPNAFFPQLTAAGAAMPCNRAFFESTRGKYGLDTEFLLSNGPFFVKTWDSDKYILLRRSESYRSAAGVTPAGVNLYLGREEPLSLFLKGSTDAAALPSEALAEAEKNGVRLEEFDDTLWYLSLNTRVAPLTDEFIRQAIAAGLDSGALAQYFPAGAGPALGLVPPAVTMGGSSYRSQPGSDFASSYDPEAARSLLRQGLARLELERMPSLTLLYPDGEGMPLLMGAVQQALQQNLGVFFNIEAVSGEELERRLSSGDYEIALTYTKASYNSPEALLGAFSSKSAQNLTGFSSPELDALLAQAKHAAELSEARSYFQAAELLVLRQAPAIPLFVATSYYGSSSKVSGIRFSPFSYRMFFQFAVKSR